MTWLNPCPRCGLQHPHNQEPVFVPSRVRKDAERRQRPELVARFFVNQALNRRA